MRYVSEYERKEGIRLEAAKITRNPERKAVAKLMLNSLWEKFGQQTNKSQTCQMTEACGLLEMLDDPLVHVQEVRILCLKLWKSCISEIQRILSKV